MKKVVKKMAKGGVSDVYRKTKADGSKVVTYKSTYTTAFGSKKPTQVTKVYDKSGKLTKGVEVVKNKVGNSQYDAGTQRIPVMLTADQIKKQNSTKKTNTPVIKKPVAPITKKTLTKLPEVNVTAKRKESTVTPKAKTVTKPVSGSATSNSGKKTVAQMWQEKTGTSWSEAKKQGLTDGSAKANLALMAKMKSNPESFSKRSTEAIPEKLAPISAKKAAENLSSSRTTPELAKPTTPAKTEKQSLGARIKSKIDQMKKGGKVKKKK